MRTGTLTLERGAAALTLAVLALGGNQALAAVYYLRAATTTVNMPGLADPITMWGYAQCNLDGTGGFGSCGLVTVPGPALTVPPGDTTLTVHLRNDLPNVGTVPTPTSLVINGLSKSMAPTWTYDAQGRRRVRSFDKEVSAGGDSGSDPYVWSNVTPGTYLYQSGTQPQVQVQMGLYGALTKNAVDATAAPTPAQAYAGVAYDNQRTLLFSEIDPALHAAVASGSYGTAPTSTFDYQPKYFLINGQPYTTGAPVIEPAGNPGQTLLRLLNAGLITHVPMIQGNRWEVVAEDGKPYPYRLSQYTALLPAAKTLDLRLTAEVGTTYPIMDRRLSLSNNGVSGGGMLAFLRWGALASGGGVGTGAGGVNQPPVAYPDPYTSVPGVTLNIATLGVLANDTDADGHAIKAVAASGATNGGGTYALNANGSFTYTPPSATFVGPDTFTYRATDGQALSALPAATVTITVAEPSAPSLLGVPLDTFDRPNSNNLGGSWSQTASEGSLVNVQISGNEAIAAAIDLGGQAIWSLGGSASSFGANQYAAFTMSAHEKSALILKAAGGSVASPDTYIRVRREGGEIVVATLMGGSTAAVFVRQAAFPVGSGSTLSAAVDAKGLVTVFQGGSYVGGVQLPDVPAWKGGGRIGVQLQTQGATINDFRGGNL